MAEYSLPDGRILNVPDSATQDDLINLQSQLAEHYPDYYAPYKEEIERTIGGHTREVLRGVPAGLTTSTISGAKGIAEYFDLGNDSAVVKGLGQFKDYLSNNIITQSFFQQIHNYHTYLLLWIHKMHQKINVLHLYFLKNNVNINFD